MAAQSINQSQSLFQRLYYNPLDCDFKSGEYGKAALTVLINLLVVGPLLKGIGYAVSSLKDYVFSRTPSNTAKDENEKINQAFNEIVSHRDETDFPITKELYRKLEENIIDLDSPPPPITIGNKSYQLDRKIFSNDSKMWGFSNAVELINNENERVYYKVESEGFSIVSRAPVPDKLFDDKLFEYSYHVYSFKIVG